MATNPWLIKVDQCSKLTRVMSNLEDERHAHRTPLLRHFDRTIWDACLRIDGQWHTTREKVF